MRKVVLFAASSLDGFIARPDGAIDWLFQDGDYGFSEFMETVDSVVLGRKTYEVAKALGDDSLTEGEHWIVSRTPEEACRRHGALWEFRSGWRLAKILGVRKGGLADWRR
ncbi:MAG: dihydrofolate reductase family protein [bacterium]|nr:dihydrofolate reductase family protein [bacterium]